MQTYDAIVVLGSQPSTETWEFPVQVYECLDRSIQLFDEHKASYIITSGRWSIAIDALGLTQPFCECDKMADYLVEKGLPYGFVLREAVSKESISNLYCLKTDFFIPHNMKRILFVVAEFRIPRLKFLCERILGRGYIADFEPIKCEGGSTYNEKLTFAVQKKFLESMKPCDHSWLDGKFFSDPIYDYWTKNDRAKQLR